MSTSVPASWSNRPTDSAGFPRWLRRHSGAAAMAGMLAYAGPLTFFAGAASVLLGTANAALLELAAWWFAYGAVLWCLLLIAGYVCEEGVRTDSAGRVVVPVVAAAAVAGVANLVTAGRTTPLVQHGLAHDATVAQLHAFTVSLVMALVFCAHLRRSRGHAAAASRLAGAQAAQRRARRGLVEARMQEVQARVDPELLFDLLGAARELYLQDPARAERYIDATVAFLRSALPRLRTQTSSLLREAELASALVHLRAVAGGSDDGMPFEVAPDAMHARFAPGILLPLVHASGAQPGTCRLQAVRRGDECIVTLSLGRLPDDAALDRVRKVLGELYGGAATLAVAAGDHSATITVTVPHELA